MVGRVPVGLGRLSFVKGESGEPRKSDVQSKNVRQGGSEIRAPGSAHELYKRRKIVPHLCASACKTPGWTVSFDSMVRRANATSRSRTLCDDGTTILNGVQGLSVVAGRGIEESQLF